MIFFWSGFPGRHPLELRETGQGAVFFLGVQILQCSKPLFEEHAGDDDFAYTFAG
jgi:hypothetical protein